MGRFLQTGLVWVRHVNNWGNFDPRRRLGDTCKAQLAEPSNELLWSNSLLGDKSKEWLAEPSTEPSQATAICLKNRRRLWDQCKELFGEHSKEPFGRRKPFAAKNPRRQTCDFAPRPLLWLKTPKLTLLRKMQKRVEALRDKFKEVMREPSKEPFGTPNEWEPETPRNLKNLGAPLLEPWWNLGGTSVQSVEPFGSPRGTCPEDQRHHETCATLVEPWQNLGGTFSGTF